MRLVSGVTYLSDYQAAGVLTLNLMTGKNTQLQDTIYIVKCQW